MCVRVRVYDCVSMCVHVRVCFCACVCCSYVDTLGMQFVFQANNNHDYHQCEQQIDSLISQATSYASGDYIVSSL